MMRRLKILLMGLVAMSLIVGASALAAESLSVNGSTTVLPIGQATAEAFMKKNPNVNISISGGGSGNGIKAVPPPPGSTALERYSQKLFAHSAFRTSLTQAELGMRS